MGGTSSKVLPPGAATYLINHIFLPPNLPQADDVSMEHEVLMLEVTIDRLSKFKGHMLEHSAIIDAAIAMITTLRDVRDSLSTGAVDEKKLRDGLAELCKEGGTIPLHLRAQNCGVLISKVGDSIHFEAFELSPLNEAVVTTKGRLRRSFPGRAISVDLKIFEQASFLETTAQTIAKMSHQIAAGTLPKVKKAGRMHDEDRDTIHPKMITELFVAFLRSVGEPVEVSSLWKNTREEVMWEDSLRPWRRSPLWLLVRVALQLTFSRSEVETHSAVDLYKAFMVFLMSYILEISQQHSVPSDLIHAMNAKLVRRLLKLEYSVDGPVLNSVQNIMRNANEILHKRWSNIMERNRQDYELPRLEQLDFGHDIDIVLPALDEYIKSMRQRAIKKVVLPFQRAAALEKYTAKLLPTWSSPSSHEYNLYNLKAVEAWVTANLSTWLESHRGEPNTCRHLAYLIRKYHGNACQLYSGNPEATSIMLLTIFELWIASDECATQTCEILRDYEPGIPRELFESLVLPFNSQMERLLRVERYLKCRNGTANLPASQIFHDFGGQTSFSVRYYNRSPEHQNLMEEIVRQATEARQNKRLELEQERAKYKDLMHLHDKAKCEYDEVVTDRINDFREYRHRAGCKKCSYKTQAAGLGIKVHEWPLPDDIQEAHSTAFELRVPSFFGHWRDVTMFLILDILKNEYKSKPSARNKYHLSTSRGLSSFYRTFSSTQRIGLLSQTKPHAVTHRRDKPVSTSTVDEVCLGSGLMYRYYDSSCECFVGNLKMTDHMAKACMYKLPDQSSVLQPFLFRPSADSNGPSPNTVIAIQAKCPNHMSLDEFKALGAIPLGYRLQWQNILLQLSVPVVDFKTAETGFVILQSIHQAGPSSNDNILRPGHDIVTDENFADGLLRALHDALNRVKENWESSQALSIFTSLASRLLSLSSSQQIKDRSLAHLGDIRSVALNWVNLLRDKTQSALNDAQRMDLSSKAAEIALTCVDSLNLDERYLDGVLSDPEVASIFIQCSIVIQEGELSILNTSNALISLLYQRWKENSYRCYPILAREILEKGSKFLEDAIKRSWPAYQAGYGWQRVSAQLDYWLVSQATPQGDDESDPLSIHFNLLTSELLVNGVPLARLPSQYEGHPTYCSLLGNSHVEVMPSTVKGMQFSGKKEHAGYTLHFGFTGPNSSKTDSDLLVQAVQGNRHYELVPSRIFRGHFPVAFVDQFVHWYDIKNDCVEFRPIEKPWTSPQDTDNWKLSKVRPDSKWQLQKDGICLIGFSSDSAEVLSGILSPLEAPERIHMKLHYSASLLEIELPKLQLGFSVQSGESLVQSRQFPGMFVDPDQSLGTLVGFRNKLMLKHETDDHRLIILPEGEVSYSRDSDHVHVRINQESALRAHAYQIDDQLGRLIDNGSLQSKLFLAYIHALTSFCLPDPFLHRTGTEQALSILSSAAVRSFDRLAKENIELLCQIAKLTPGRRYYPEDERVMQTVDWSRKLGFLAQHGGFYSCVKSIFDQASRAQIFHPEIMLPQLHHVEWDLLERDCIRSSTFRVSSFGAEDHTTMEDTEYSARDREHMSAQGLNAFAMSSIIYQKRSSLHSGVQKNLGLHLWNFLEQTAQILGPCHPLPSSDLKYDSLLLSASSEFISRHWLNLHRTFSQGSGVDQFHLMIWLSTLAYAPNANLDIIQALASFFALPAMAHVPLPTSDSFRLQRGLGVEKCELLSIAESALLPLADSPEANLTAIPKEKEYDFKKRQQIAFEKSQRDALDRLVNVLEAQWPCEVPATPIDPNTTRFFFNPTKDFSLYIDINKVVQEVTPLFKAWTENNQFRKYLHQIGDLLTSQMVSPWKTRFPSITTSEWSLRRKHGYISIDNLFIRSAPMIPPIAAVNMPELLSSVAGERKSISCLSALRLSALIERLEAGASSNYELEYIRDLRESFSSLQYRKKEYLLRWDAADIKEALTGYLSLCKEQVHKIQENIISALSSPIDINNSSTQLFGFSAIAVDVGQWPRLSPIILLQQLTRGRWPKLSQVWKRYVVGYGIALSNLQRAERLLRLCGKDLELVKELQNFGHTNWHPFEHPEALLLEIESGITIRDVQIEIARQMADPPNGQNSVMQLNMGEGKSSVIVPLVAAALADGSRLVRVIVAKPQSKQMLEMLASKLGGLLDRRIYHMPFSRALKLGEAEAYEIGNIYRECMAVGGVLLVQPEHILSFKLMGLECLISSKEAVGNSLLRTQHFFDTSSRDIVDESDENFSVKFELIYTMGMPRPIESSPDRWICIQQVLELVKFFLPAVKNKFPNSIDVHEAHPGSFPRTRILRADAEQCIFSSIAKRICETGLNSFPIARQPASVRQAVFRYITERNLTMEEIDQVENQGPEGVWADTTSSTLLLLRGLFAGGVLAFAFGQKRWKVNYGLDVTRQPGTKVAVPYRAKDNPTPRSEFSHPDVVIVLTSLSYYYGGLKNGDLFLAFGHLSRSDQADIEYQAWVKDAPNLEQSFHHLVGVNLKDQVQCEIQVFPDLRYSKGAIDYFLSHIVFPREMKEFPHKLSSSGWDVGQTKTHPTTGFSGTNDSRVVLPLSLQHVDLQEQKHTNALVPNYLLQEGNSIALMPPRFSASSSDADLLLTEVTKMAIPVIIDVGAQILELSNAQVAGLWLKKVAKDDQWQAVVFFNDSDELSVLDRKGNIEPLQISSFAKRLGVCLVFLDEAHTRGTDLKLPPKYRAAVTLGPNLTKDRLIQACMRMRRLDNGHSVVFFVPQEISNKILARTSKIFPTSIDVSDVLSWAISETYVDIRRSMPLWAAQGKRFVEQSKLWAEVRSEGGFTMSKNQAEKFLEEESRSLDARYRPASRTDVASFIQEGQSTDLDLIIERCRQFRNLEFNSATLQEEQERELSPEIEQERQVQKPALAAPATHVVHPDVLKFVSNGIPNLFSKGYKPAFEALRDTSAAAHLNVKQFPKDLLLTEDFSRTVKISGKSYISDAFQRPVQWILTSTACGDDNTVRYLMIVSPHEAQQLLPIIKRSKKVALHLYTPRPNLSFRALDGLDLYTVPAQTQPRIVPRYLVVQLNLFSGQLYLSSFQEYVEVCKFLGLAWNKTEDDYIVAADGFIVRGGSGTSVSIFKESPVKFLRVLLTKIRRNCEGIDKTHMGKILDGRLLRPSDFGEEEDI